MTPRPDFRFLVDYSHFPTRVRIDELVSPRWVVANYGDTEECIFTSLWKGAHRYLARATIPRGGAAKFYVEEPGIPFEELMLALTGETVAETRTVEFIFRVGFLVNGAFAHTDEWRVGTIIEVPEPRVFPWGWVLLGAAGVGIVGYVATKE